MFVVIVAIYNYRFPVNLNKNPPNKCFGILVYKFQNNRVFLFVSKAHTQKKETLKTQTRFILIKIILKHMHSKFVKYIISSHQLYEFEMNNKIYSSSFSL